MTYFSETESTLSLVVSIILKKKNALTTIHSP